MVQGLKKLGIAARFSDKNEIKRGMSKTLHCYAAAAGHSIFAGEKKLIGAAGMVRNGVISIHGSIPTKVSFPDADIFFGQKNFENHVKIACLEDFLPEKTIISLPNHITSEYENTFKATVIKTALCAEERTMVDKLCSEKYSFIDWKEKNKVKV